jgi:hypothetical protein
MHLLQHSAEVLNVLEGGGGEHAVDRCIFETALLSADLHDAHGVADLTRGECGIEPDQLLRRVQRTDALQRSRVLVAADLHDPLAVETSDGRVDLDEVLAEPGCDLHAPP